MNASAKRQARLDAARAKIKDYLYDRRENRVTVRELGRRARIGENAMLKLLKEHGYDPKQQRHDDAIGEGLRGSKSSPNPRRAPAPRMDAMIAEANRAD